MRPPDRLQASIDWLPQTLLLLGTDAAGKNHVARVWTQRMAQLGVEVRQQEGWLSASAAEPEADDDKSWLSHVAEQTFLWVFPCIAWGMPWALRFLMRRDVQRFSMDGQRRLIISHSALREGACLVSLATELMGAHLSPRRRSSVAPFRGSLRAQPMSPCSGNFVISST